MPRLVGWSNTNTRKIIACMHFGIEFIFLHLFCNFYFLIFTLVVN